MQSVNKLLRNRIKNVTFVTSVTMPKRYKSCNINKIRDINNSISITKPIKTTQEMLVDSINNNNSSSNMLHHLLRQLQIGENSIYNSTTIPFIKKIADKVVNSYGNLHDDSTNLSEHGIKLYDEFMKYSYFTHADTQVNITQLFNKYDLHGYELFYCMYKKASPFGVGNFSHRVDEDANFTLHTAKEIIKESNYVDYYNGKGIKNSFRFNNTQQIVCIKRFDDRNYSGCAIECILTLLYSKILCMNLKRNIK